MRNDKDISGLLDPAEWDHIVVPVSAGKDSQSVLALAVSTPGVREKLTVVHQWTGYDHTLTMAHLDYIRDHYGLDEIVGTRHKTFRDIFDLIRRERYFPSSVARNCTSRMKIAPFALWLYHQGLHTQRTVVLMGMRGPESQNRSKQYAEVEPSDKFSICDISREYQKRLKNVQVMLPIVQWSTSEVFDFLRRRGDKVNPLYGRGHQRVGCYPCLLAGDREWWLAAQDPEGRANIQRLIDLEEEIGNNPNPNRKLIKIHPVRDVRKILADAQAPGRDPFGLHGSGEDASDNPCNQCMS